MKNKNAKLKGLRKNNLKKKLGEKCVYCKCINKILLTIDHKIPLARGGEDLPRNKQVCCFNCNQLKGALTHNEFKKYLKILNGLKDLNKLHCEMKAPFLRMVNEGFPSTEKDILKEIDKEKYESDDKNL